MVFNDFYSYDIMITNWFNGFLGIVKILTSLMGLNPDFCGSEREQFCLHFKIFRPEIKTA